MHVSQVAAASAPSQEAIEFLLYRTEVEGDALFGTTPPDHAMTRHLRDSSYGVRAAISFMMMPAGREQARLNVRSEAADSWFVNGEESIVRFIAFAIERATVLREAGDHRGANLLDVAAGCAQCGKFDHARAIVRSIQRVAESRSDPHALNLPALPTTEEHTRCDPSNCTGHGSCPFTIATEKKLF